MRGGRSGNERDRRSTYRRDDRYRDDRYRGDRDRDDRYRGDRDRDDRYRGDRYRDDRYRGDRDRDDRYRGDRDRGDRYRGDRDRDDRYRDSRDMRRPAQKRSLQDGKERSSKRARRSTEMSSNVWNGWTTPSGSSSSSSSNINRVSLIETNPNMLKQRQKQIDYGKNTIGYDNYVKTVRKRDRRGYTHNEPGTPKIDRKYSRRQWLGILGAWRRCLHAYDDISATVSLSSSMTDKTKNSDDSDFKKETGKPEGETAKKVAVGDDDSSKEEITITIDEKDMEEFENDDLL